MSGATFTVVISRVDGTIFEGPVTALSVPSILGEMVVLPHHEPLIALLKQGNIKVTSALNATPQSFAIEGGVIEISNNQAIVLV